MNFIAPGIGIHNAEEIAKMSTDEMVVYIGELHGHIGDLDLKVKMHEANLKTAAQVYADLKAENERLRNLTTRPDVADDLEPCPRCAELHQNHNREEKV